MYCIFSDFIQGDYFIVKHSFFRSIFYSNLGNLKHYTHWKNFRYFTIIHLRNISSFMFFLNSNPCLFLQDTNNNNTIKVLIFFFNLSIFKISYSYI